MNISIHIISYHRHRIFFFNYLVQSSGYQLLTVVYCPLCSKLVLFSYFACMRGVNKMMFIVSKFSPKEQPLRNKSSNNVLHLNDQNAHPMKYDDFPRPEAIELFMYIPMTHKNSHWVANVYISVHKTREQLDVENQLGYVEAKRAHHSLLIDIAGESDDLELRGVSLHLTANVKLRNTVFNAHSHPVQRSSLLHIFKPNPKRLHPPDTVSNPRQWVAMLEQQVSGVLGKNKVYKSKFSLFFRQNLFTF